MKNETFISVIVAVYNVEKYIRRCLDSILAQTFRDFELIIVDDGSPDGCHAICDEYASKDERITVVHKENGGLPAARKTGFDNSIGKYLLFIDGDDWIENTMLEIMLGEAKRQNSDVVICDVYKDYGKVKKAATIHFPQEKKDIMETFIRHPGFMNYFWNKLIKRDIFIKNKIDFPQNITLCEDLYVIFKIVYYAKVISHVSVPLYHYMQTNPSAMTKNITEKSYSSKMAVLESLIAFCVGKEKDFDTEKIINFYKIYNRLPLIIYKNLRDAERWSNTYPESNKYIWKVPLRFDYKLLSWLCSKRLHALAFFLQDLKGFLC